MALRIVILIADGVAYAHQQGLVHRDIKPSNILLHVKRPTSEKPSEGNFAEGLGFVPKLADFGLAKLIDRDQSLTLSGAMVGTALYMAPEQVEGRGAEIGPWTDVYGLGALLYELLCGCPPISGENDLETLRRILTEAPWPVRLVRRDVSPTAEAVCLKCLEKNCRRRYQDVGELREDLRRALDGEPTRARPQSILSRRFRRIPQRRVGLMAGVSVLMLAAAIFAFLPNNLAGWQDDSTIPIDYQSISAAFYAWSDGEEAALQELYSTLHPQIDVGQLSAPGDIVVGEEETYRICAWLNPETGKRHVYQYVTAPFSMRWPVSRDAAASLSFDGHQGHLVTITSEAEHRFVIEHMLRHVGELDSCVWIGLTDEDQEGRFTWVNGEPLEFSAWMEGEPNDLDGRENFVEYLRYDVAAVDLPEGSNLSPFEAWKWNDASGIVDNPRGFIVEYELDD